MYLAVRFFFVATLLPLGTRIFLCHYNIYLNGSNKGENCKTSMSKESQITDLQKEEEKHYS